MKLTVFTPTYNRAYIIENLYRSLQRQTCHDFEWLVVDDGSSDNTQELFRAWQQKENPFPIRYVYQENGGKHRAINRGLDLAEGELFFIVDSDDYLTDDAVEWIVSFVAKLPEGIKFAGICGIRADWDGNDLGKSFCGEYIDCTSLERSHHGIEGDKAEVFYTHILRKYPFPEFENEKFITEAVVWDRIAADGYMLRFANKVIYVAKYRDDGLSAQGLELYYRNPQGYGLYLRQSRKYGKFSKNVQRFFDTQCYLSWHKEMSLVEIANLIDCSPVTLIAQVLFCVLRERLSVIKKKLLGKVKFDDTVKKGLG